MTEDLIPIGEARLVVWPDETSGFLRLRVIRGEPTDEQRAWLAARSGRLELADWTGTGDAQTAFMALGRAHGWHHASEVRREFGRIACPLGEAFRANRAAGWSADAKEAAA